MDSNLDRLLARWQIQSSIQENVAYWNIDPIRKSENHPFSVDMDTRLQNALHERGIHSLYSHQANSWDIVGAGKHLVVVTGTASGKTMCYNLPILQHVLIAPGATSLYLFPTKALAADQLDNLKEWSRQLNGTENKYLRAASYDGDTPNSTRSGVRKQVNLLLTNPDMLHIGILPHHTQWERFFRNLRFVVIDEIHTYRGVFGSHLANVVRRLKRVAAFYGARPQFVMTSATVANPEEHASRLIDEPDVALIDHDGSPRGEKHFVLYNPPIVNEEMGIRASASSESMRLADDLLSYHVQTILFSKSRRGVEFVLRQLRNQYGNEFGDLDGYRSGYLPAQRRAIEQNLREGKTRAVVATSALELGIDIGSMDAAILISYPGSIAATLQQAGRAGRRTETSCAVLVASANPLDQFLVHHPEYLFGRSPEKVLIDPDNLLILLKHIECAAFELPFSKHERFGSVSIDLLRGMLELLVDSGMVHEGSDQYFWMDEAYPAGKISLRSASEATILLQVEQAGRLHTIGEVDELSSYWMVHPQAVYMHAGESYFVEHLDLEKKTAQLKLYRGDYYTEPMKHLTMEKNSDRLVRDIKGGQIHYGDITVTTQVVGFKRLNWITNEVMDIQDILMPPETLRTTAYWLIPSDDSLDVLRDHGLWKNDPNEYGPTWNAIRKLVKRRDQNTCQNCSAVEQTIPFHVHHKIPFRNFQTPEQANQMNNLITLCPSCHQKAEESIKMRSGMAGLGYVLHHLVPLHLMCDISDLDSATDMNSPLAENRAAIVIYELIPAGIGLTEQLFENHEVLMREAFELVSECGCKDGCPSCVGPAGENGIGGKKETLALLALLNGEQVEVLDGIIE